jgi:hypothetical protein
VELFRSSKSPLAPLPKERRNRISGDVKAGRVALDSADAALAVAYALFLDSRLRSYFIVLSAVVIIVIIANLATHETIWWLGAPLSVGLVAGGLGNAGVVRRARESARLNRTYFDVSVSD